MSIYDAIANPKVPSVLPQLQFMMSLEDRSRRRKFEDQEAEGQAQLAASQAKGRGLIRSYTQPQAGPPAQDEMPSEAPPVEGDATQPAQDYSELLQPLENISTEEITNASSTRELADKLAALPGNEKLAKMYYDQADKAEERAASETKDEREENERLLEASGGLLKRAAEFEDAGKFKEAEQLFNQVNDFVSQDPRFSKNKEIMDFYAAFPTYQPNLATLMYGATMMGGKARDQLQRGETQTGVADRAAAVAKRHADRIRLSEKSGERADKRIQMQEEKQKFTEKKLSVNSTDKILTYKRQEEKDLKKVKLDLVKALKLAATGKNFPLVDKLLQQSMSKWENTSVRAYAELERFKNYGDISDRVAGHISQFFAGAMTEDQRTMAVKTARSLLDEFIMPVLDESGDYWRRIASERGLDPDQVSPYGSKEEVGEDYRDGIISREVAEKILQKSRFK